MSKYKYYVLLNKIFNRTLSCQDKAHGNFIFAGCEYQNGITAAFTNRYDITEGSKYKLYQLVKNYMLIKVAMLPPKKIMTERLFTV